MIYQQARIKTLEYTVQAVQAVQKTKTTKHVISESVEGMSGLFRTQDFKRGEKEMRRKKVKKKKRPGITGDAFLKKKQILPCFCFHCVPLRRIFKEVWVVYQWIRRKLDFGISPSRPRIGDKQMNKAFAIKFMAC